MILSNEIKGMSPNYNLMEEKDEKVCGEYFSQFCFISDRV